MQSARLSLVIINVFQMTELLRRTYYLNEQETKYVSINLNNDDLKLYVKIGTFSRHAVLNDIKWFILVTFKGDISKNEVHKLSDSQHTLSVYYGRYIRITIKNTQVYLRTKDLSQLMYLASGCIDTEVIKYSRLQDEFSEWRNKFFESKSFLNPPDTNVLDFSTLFNELKYKNFFFSC
jgi:hypothetical protein